MRRTLEDRLLARRRIVDTCWVFTGAHDTCGYGRMWLNGGHESAHRAAWLAFRGDPGESHVLHLCDRRDCFNPDHLMLGTHQLNMQQRDQWGKGIRGDRVATNRLTESNVREAISLRRAGETWSAIAEHFDVHPSTIRHAVTGRTWRHLERV